MKIILYLLILLYSPFIWAQNKIVKDANALEDAVKQAKPGDTVFLANQEWKNVALTIYGKGTAIKPIVIMPKATKKVIISGQSFLRIAGEHLIIKGLHFKNGYSPQREVITFRINNDLLANHCRLTESVIEDFSQPERFKNDVWVVFWGKRNRVDHCTFIDKLSAGPVIIAELNDERSQENYHSIDANYFKGRQRFGSNGGETIRIGVSRYSLTASRTQIINNYFERCNGEVEIVSIKSGENNISFNTFYECEGSLVLRHGSNNTVEGNLFLGNHKPFTGGVRVINPGHKVFNNVFKDLKGTAFRSALAVMNGVPNSLINRYYQVKDAQIERNTFINCGPVLFGAGKDAERTLSPQSVTFSSNLMVNPTGNLIDDTNKDGGISLKNNAVVNLSKAPLTDGFTLIKVNQHKKDALSIPYHKNYGADIKKLPFVQKSQTGAGWYVKEEVKPSRANKTFSLASAQSQQIHKIIANAISGDTICFTDATFYKLDKEIVLDKMLHLIADKSLKGKPILVNSSFKTLPAFITIANGGSLAVKGLAFKGNFESYGDVQCGIRSTDQAMNKHYNVKIDGCEFYDYNESTFSGFKASKSTFADTLLITNSLFRNISGMGINLAEEKEDKGIYGVENTIIKNCVFTNILGSAINVYRGGNDESTLGPFVTIDYCTFNEVENREQGTVVRLSGAQQAVVTNSIFMNSGQGGRSIEFREFRWDDIKVDYCNFYNAGRIDSFYGTVAGKNIYQIKPDFIDSSSFNFNLKPGSALSDKSTTGKTLGANL
ncbi:chondroitinase-B domain-containing protein [Pedobacter glucosidilyticus]|uniref:chondroitinase-B domain-containing protein n=1 Tax=Pedobacter glucosidilyticus TaxID=1122941 RepID=UPI000415FC06|nr:chondroitinase-B domain-containing protein [Pedobacter glucosidilyticus]